ncbi:glycosyltransferase [Sphingomonas crocodyli]|uniref:Glycosyltransferase n=1 Tax=Sphingomonas crocodyli TaxID=1979270 RepID=A0A437LXK5_9SPHN|nr:glycosyltransferase [Sphingomonas crocodyli]RVT90155.1 glycosyltransferase [Sphingomonas crocodyli]
MRILIISSLFPPDALGGAEISAWNLACWLRDHGHEVGVLTTTAGSESATTGVIEDGLRVWRVRMPRPYPMAHYGNQPAAAKLVWHLLDHLDPANIDIVRDVLREFKPDFASVHLLAGLGWNSLAELARHDVPVLFALPDLALACVRSGMFRGDHTCQRQCTECRLSSWWKQRQIGKLRRLGFYSPSRANLQSVESLVPLRKRPRRVIFNPNRYPVPVRPYRAGSLPRFLYAGRLHRTKGVDVLLDAADIVAGRGLAFTLAIAGDGPDGEMLRERYGNRPWLTFHGHVSQQRVSDLMAEHDLLCLPSVWAENSPGVAIQALSQGMPVLASNVGGVPELVDPGITGALLPAGDTDTWAETLAALILQPHHIRRWREAASVRSDRFDPEQLGARLFELIEEISAQGPLLRPDRL